MPPRRHETPAGFTLVELLVVVAILTVLIAILLPAAGRAREHANRVKCASHLRSIGQALTAYTSHYGYYPGFAASGAAVWPVRLRPFLGGDQEVFYCPSQDERCRWVKGAAPVAPGVAATEVHARYGYEVGEPVLWAGTPFSYGYNGQGVGAKNTRALGYNVIGGDDRELPASRVRMPAEMVAVADADGDGSWDMIVNPSTKALFPGQIHPGKPHLGGPNVLFCDGHVQWFPLADLVIPEKLDTADQTIRWGNIVRMWNCDHAWGVD